MRNSTSGTTALHGLIDGSRNEAFMKTQGEELFEKYLETQGLSFVFEKEHAGRSKRPDYTIERNGKTIVVDVKDFDAPERTMRGAFSFDPYPRIREKIERGRDKFKEFKDICCGLVLYNRGHPLVMLHDVNTMLGAMYGDSGFTFPVDTTTGIGDISKMEHAFLGGGKMVRPKWTSPQNTTISALITLSTIRPDYLRLMDMVHEYPDLSPNELVEQAIRNKPDFDSERAVPRVIVWHNAVARIPFPEDLFRGPYDTHFGVVEEDGKTFQRATYRGTLLPARVKV